jgi:RNA polymerase sigma-70 factor, ECF subfamily
VDQYSDLNAWMARLADGNRSAFTPVFQLLWPSVHRTCLALVRNDADADDAAQQAMEKILTRASDYDPSRPALPWAVAIATWECRTLLRRRGRRREIGDDTTAHAASDAAPDEEAAQRDLVEAALAAMQELSPVDRETLVATFWEEAAAVGGATLRKRRERALGRLRDAFRRLYGLG